MIGICPSGSRRATRRWLAPLCAMAALIGVPATWGQTPEDRPPAPGAALGGQTRPWDEPRWDLSRPVPEETLPELAVPEGEAPLPAVQEDPLGELGETLNRGPLHEAFDQQLLLDPTPGVLAPQAPPAPVQEAPPEVRPDNEEAQWIPGYWAWDEEQKQFLWVSGVWRIPPPDRRWVPGEWVETDDGFRWVSGFWAEASVSELQYLPSPPASLEQGPSSPPPQDDAYWVQGSWIYQDTGYAWQAGYWASHRDGWVWVASSYCWTPRGVVYVPGYWDYSPLSRGLLFAPVCYYDPYALGPGYIYQPRIACATSRLLLHLFVFPGRTHYYWGDYYAPNFVTLGYRPWFSGGWGGCYSPTFHYYSRYYGRRGIDYRGRLDGWHRYYATHADGRPPRTYREANRRLNQADRAGALQQAVVSVSLRDRNQVRELVEKQHLGRLRSVDAAQQEQLARTARQLQEVAALRRRLESTREADGLRQLQGQLGQAARRGNGVNGGDAERRAPGDAGLAGDQRERTAGSPRNPRGDAAVNDALNRALSEARNREAGGSLKLPQLDDLRSAAGRSAASRRGIPGGSPPTPFVDRSQIGDLRRSLPGAVGGGADLPRRGNSSGEAYSQQRLEALQRALNQSRSGGSRGAASGLPSSRSGRSNLEDLTRTNPSSTGRRPPAVPGQTGASGSSLNPAQSALQRMQQSDPNFSRQLDRFRSSLPDSVRPPTASGGSASSPFSNRGGAPARSLPPGNRGGLGSPSGSSPFSNRGALGSPSGSSPFSNRGGGSPRSFSPGGGNPGLPGGAVRGGSLPGGGSPFGSPSSRIPSGSPGSSFRGSPFGGGGISNFRSSPVGPAGPSRSFGGGAASRFQTPAQGFGGGAASRFQTPSKSFGGGGKK